MYCKSGLDQFKLSRQFSSGSIRLSSVSLPGRENLTVSISERRSAFQTRRRYSDSCLVHGRRLRGSTGRSSLSGYPYLTKRELVMFSPIHEHNEEGLSKPESEVCESSSKCLKSTPDQLDSSTANNVALDSSNTNTTVLLQFTEEAKSIAFHYKITEI